MVTPRGVNCRPCGSHNMYCGMHRGRFFVFLRWKEFSRNMTNLNERNIVFRIDIRMMANGPEYHNYLGTLVRCKTRSMFGTEIRRSSCRRFEEEGCHIACI